MQVSTTDSTPPFPLPPNAPKAGPLTPDAIGESTLSMLDYLGYTGATSIYSQDTLNLTAAQTPKLQDRYFIALQEIMSQLRSIAVRSDKNTAQWDQIYRQQQAMNEAIAEYNTDCTAATNSFNNNSAVTGYQQAITNYRSAQSQVSGGTMSSNVFNAGPQAQFNSATSRYNSALATYNAAMTEAKNKYQAAAANYNSTIASINIATLNQNLVNQSHITEPLGPVTATAPTVPTSPTPYTPQPAGLSYTSTPSSLPTVTAPTISSTVAQSNPAPVSTEALQEASTMLLGEYAKSKGVLLNNQDKSISRASRDDGTGSIILPDSYITRSPRLFTSGSPTLTGIDTGAGGSSPLLTLLSAGLSNRNLARILASALYTSINRQADQPVSDNDITLLQVLSISLLVEAAKASAQPTLNQLPESPGVTNTAPVATNVASSLAFADNIRNLVASAFIEIAVDNLFSSNPNLVKLSASDQQAFKASIAAALKIGLLNVALSQIANTAGLPELSTQILANVSGGSLTNALSPSDASAINVALDNPILMLFLKATLTKLLMELSKTIAVLPSDVPVAAAPEEKLPTASSEAPTPAGIAKPKAEVIINNAINTVLKTPTFNNRVELENALTSALQKEGLNPAAAAKIANTAATLVLAEGNLPLLDTIYQQQNIARVGKLLSAAPVSASPLATASPTLPPPAPPPPVQPPPASVVAQVTPPVAEEAPPPPPPPPPSPPPPPQVSPDVAQNDTPAPGTLERILQDRLIAEGNKNGNVRAAIVQTLELDFETNREFRTSLIDSLLQNGINAADAAKIANLAGQLTSLQESPEGASPLADTSKPMTLAALTEEWSNYLLKLLAPELDSYRAKRLSDQSIQTLIGENSIMHQYNEQIRILRQYAQEAALQDFNRALPTLSRPSLPSFALRQEISEIVRTEITAYMDPSRDSLMSTANMPYNFKRNMDVRI